MTLFENYYRAKTTGNPYLWVLLFLAGTTSAHVVTRLPYGVALLIILALTLGVCADVIIQHIRIRNRITNTTAEDLLNKIASSTTGLWVAFFIVINVLLER